ncbi:hypothetical protein AB3S75_045594 [Citrus x aurantiifolia]
MKTNRSFHIILITVFLSIATGDYHYDDHCVYTLYVKTGSGIKSGTDSKISIALGDAVGRSVWVPDLKSWGLMGPHHDYYERGNVDVFSGRGPCIGSPICNLNVSSDGSGMFPSWYCEYVEVTSTGPHRSCDQSAFYVDQWLSSRMPPFESTAVIDGCGMSGGRAVRRIKRGSLIVGKARERSEAY